MRDDVKDLIAIDNIAVRIDKQTAIGVTVQRNTQCCAAALHGDFQRIEMRRATTSVDVESIGMSADDGDVRAEFLEYGRCDPVYSALGTVSHTIQGHGIISHQ